MGRPGGAVRPLEEIREAMAEGGSPNADGTPTRASYRQLVALFSTVTDPRQQAKVRYPLNEVLLVAFLAVMCDANTWADMERLGNAKLRWLRRFAPFRAGVPSHDTFRYVLGLVDFAELQSLVVTFVVENLYAVRSSLGAEAPRAQLAVDGKSERGTGRRYAHSAGGELRDVQTLHVWDTSSNVCLWSEAIEEKTNEIPVAQRWLADPANDISGAIVSADAMHTQRETARIIRSRGADYVLGLKGNQAGLREAAGDYFADPGFLRRIRRLGADYLKVTEKAHGQLEVRETYRCDPVEGEFAGWEGLRSLVCQVKTCTKAAPGSGPRSEVRYYISSLADVGEIATAIRRHWICESSHWLLDAAFRQDECQDADRRRFENRAMLNKLCLSLARLMQAHPHYARRRTSVAGIRKMIGWETEENFGRLLEVVDRGAFEATVNGLRLTAADRRRYERILEEAEEDLW